MWDGYLTREEQYELRKKIFHKGEYMILNYALMLMIITAVFSIIFVSVWHAYQDNDAGMYVMVGVALSIVMTVVVLVKIRLRLARRAPGGYKFRRDEKCTVIDNVRSEPDIEKSNVSEKCRQSGEAFE
jgi:RsiW-degrading membrane proteinase PrsW (M82 family)